MSETKAEYTIEGKPVVAKEPQRYDAYNEGMLPHHAGEWIKYDDQELCQIKCLADIREAVGDHTGKLMQDELVKRIVGIVSDRDELRAAIDRGGWDISLCGLCGLPVVCLPDGAPLCESCAKDHG